MFVLILLVVELGDNAMMKGGGGGAGAGASGGAVRRIQLRLEI